MLEPTLFARLNSNPDIADIVTGILPSQPEINQPIPYLVYTVQSEEQGTYTSGQSRLTKYTFQVEGFTQDIFELGDLMDQVKLSLNGWRAGGVQYCRITSSGADKQEKYHHGIQAYEIWVNNDLVPPLPDNNAGHITRGEDFIELEACDNTLRLDCDGLTFNGEDITAVGSQTFIYEQSIASTTWNITHNLNQFPSVTIVDSGGTVVIGDVQYVNSNSVTLSFVAPFGGRAYLNV